MRRQRRRGKKWETELRAPKWGKQGRRYSRHQSRVFPAPYGKDHSEADKHNTAWEGPCWSWHIPRRMYIPQKVHVGTGKSVRGRKGWGVAMGWITAILLHCSEVECDPRQEWRNEVGLGRGKRKILFQWISLSLFLSTQIYFTCQ